MGPVTLSDPLARTRHFFSVIMLTIWDSAYIHPYRLQTLMIPKSYNKRHPLNDSFEAVASTRWPYFKNLSLIFCHGKKYGNASCIGVAAWLHKVLHRPTLLGEADFKWNLGFLCSAAVVPCHFKWLTLWRQTQVERWRRVQKEKRFWPSELGLWAREASSRSYSEYFV